MQILLPSYFYLYFLSGMILLIPALFTWQRRNVAGIRSLFFTMLFMSAILFLGAIEIAFVDLNIKKNILILEDLAYTSCITAMFIFIADYFFKLHWLTRYLPRFLWSAVAILLLLDATNSWHGMVWTNYTMGPSGSNLMYAQPGPWYLAIISIFDLVGFFVFSFLGVYAIHRKGQERWRTFFILVGMIVPFLTPLVMFLITDNTISSNILPIVYAVSGLFISWVVFEDQHQQLRQKSLDLKLEQENLAQKLADRSNKMAGLFDIILMGNQQIPPEELMASLLEKISSLMDGAMICLYKKTDQGIQISASFGLSEKQIEKISFLPADWLPVTTDARIVPDISAANGLPGAFFQAGFNSLFARWLHYGDLHPKVLIALRTLPHNFTVEEISLVNAITDETRVILENARMRVIAIEQALYRERHRISRDLHDTVTQSINSIVLTSDVAGAIVEKSDLVKLKKILISLKIDAQQALKELRLLLFELRLETPDDADLIDTLQSRIDLVEKKAGLEVKLTVFGHQEWSPILAGELYYIATEALNNSLKHSFATRVEIMIEGNAECVILKVRDDGHGFHPGQINRGFGLRGMAERASLMGGSIDIQTSPGNGTVITATLPVRLQPLHA